VVDSKYGSAWGGSCSREPIGPYEVGLWKNIKRGWGSFVVIPDLNWKMALRLDSDMIFGVGIQPLRKPLWFYLVLLHKGCFSCETRGIFWR
jgi:hypothetical protein